ncbi:hypothetical protein NHX12_018062 [Muraenolepis orangiensis]|uniref:Uncharacterized protein n=1 Tax=Muraenolepis orangiensis TaxID=630683 RepID=A0A9Q0EW28_9TELE|nr:hypothetical protein NHX12_018062 [Muraenolepis orangiensis]
MFRIPEFRWSHMHQRLLTDLLFSIETDVQMWRSHSTKTVLDFVNSSENVVFVHNTVHLISQHELENIEPSQGLTVEASVTFLQRLINLVDVLVFASSLNFTEIEAEKNMSSGGILRQCLRLVCAMAVRNCLECQQHAHFHYGNTGSTAAQSPVDVVTGGQSPIGDLDRLLQDMDINRLRAVVFRDIEDSKQAQFLALAVVYFISVLMVSKYRDILEPHSDKKTVSRSRSTRSTDSRGVQSSLDLGNGVPLPRCDSGIRDDQASTSAADASASAADASASAADASASGPDAVSEALSTLSSEVRPPPGDAKGKNVKDILRSLVSAPADDIIVEAGLLPPAFLGGLGDASRDLSRAQQFRSFDRSVVVAPKKAGTPSSSSSGASSSSAPVPSTTVSAGMPTDGVAVVSAAQSVSAEAAALFSPPPALFSPPPALFSPPQPPPISERLEHALEKAAPLLREIFVDFAPFLSRTLLGSHGQELLIEGTKSGGLLWSGVFPSGPFSPGAPGSWLMSSNLQGPPGSSDTLPPSPNPEWQNSIQKNAGLAFIELVNEGRYGTLILQWISSS